jgi:hypothetical protein
VLAERVSKRAAQPHAESDAGPAVLVRQLANEEPLSADEMAWTVRFDTEVAPSAFARLEYWQALLDRLGIQATHETAVLGASAAHA